MPEQTDPSQTKNGPPRLRAMGFGELLDTIFSLYRAHFWSFLGIAIPYFIAMLIGVSISFFDDWIGKNLKALIWILTIFAIFGVSVFVVSALVFASTQAYLDGKIRMRAVLKHGMREFFRCFVSSLVFGLWAIFVGFVILLLFIAVYRTVMDDNTATTVIGGFCMFLILFSVASYIITYWCFYVSSVFVEEIPRGTGWGRSGTLIDGSWWRVNGTMLSVFMLHFGISFIFRIAFAILLTLTGLADIQEFLGTVQWLAFFQLPGNLTEFHLLNVLMPLVNLGIDTITMPIWVIGGTLLYFNQRIRKEGFDIEVMATHPGE